MFVVKVMGGKWLWRSGAGNYQTTGLESAASEFCTEAEAKVAAESWSRGWAPFEIIESQKEG